MKELLNNDERLTILELSRSLVLCEDEPSFRGCFDRVRSLLPIASAVGMLAKPAEDGVLLDAGSFSLDFPQRFIDLYLQRGISLRDPLLAGVLRGSPPLYWRHALERGELAEGLAELMRECDLGDGYLHGVAAGGAGRPGSCFAFHTPSLTAPDARCETVLAYLAPFLHLGLERTLTGWRTDGGQSADRRLTPNQIEVLRWVRAGKNNWEIARILAVSENTVKYHMRNILKRLGVTNRACAVAKALEGRLFGD